MTKSCKHFRNFFRMVISLTTHIYDGDKTEKQNVVSLLQVSRTTVRLSCRSALPYRTTLRYVMEPSGVVGHCRGARTTVVRMSCDYRTTVLRLFDLNKYICWYSQLDICRTTIARLSHNVARQTHDSHTTKYRRANVVHVRHATML